jgi:hypothetical protein
MKSGFKVFPSTEFESELNEEQGAGKGIALVGKEEEEEKVINSNCAIIQLLLTRLLSLLLPPLQLLSQ